MRHAVFRCTVRCAIAAAHSPACSSRRRSAPSLAGRATCSLVRFAGARRTAHLEVFLSLLARRLSRVLRCGSHERARRSWRAPADRRRLAGQAMPQRGADREAVENVPARTCRHACRRSHELPMAWPTRSVAAAPPSRPVRQQRSHAAAAALAICSSADCDVGRELQRVVGTATGSLTAALPSSVRVLARSRRAATMRTVGACRMRQAPAPTAGQRSVSAAVGNLE